MSHTEDIMPQDKMPHDIMLQKYNAIIWKYGHNATLKTNHLVVLFLIDSWMPFCPGTFSAMLFCLVFLL